MRTKEEIEREIRVVQESLRLLEAELTEVLAAEAQFKVAELIFTFHEAIDDEPAAWVLEVEPDGDRRFVELGAYHSLDVAITAARHWAADRGCYFVAEFTIDLFRGATAKQSTFNQGASSS